MKKILVGSALVALLGACGGGGGGGGSSFKDPDSVSFEYGAAQPVGGGAYTAAINGEEGLSTALAVQGQTDDSMAMQGAQNVANLPMDMADAFTGSLPFAQARALEQGRSMVASRAKAYLSGNMAAATDGFTTDCWRVVGTATTGSITFTNCTVTETDPDSGSTFTVTINGSFNREGGHVFWDATATLAMRQPADGSEMAIDAAEHMKGDITYDLVAKGIDGYARTDITLSVRAQGQNIAGAVTYNADFDHLTYLDSPAFCINGGTLTLKRIWSVRPSHPDIDPADVADGSVKLTWVGPSCGNINVQFSL